MSKQESYVLGYCETVEQLKNFSSFRSSQVAPRRDPNIFDEACYLRGQVAALIDILKWKGKEDVCS